MTSSAHFGFFPVLRGVDREARFSTFSPEPTTGSVSFAHHRIRSVVTHTAMSCNLVTVTYRSRSRSGTVRFFLREIIAFPVFVLGL